MEALSVTQEYLMFALEKNKGKLGSSEQELLFMVAGGIIELLSGGYIVHAEKGKLVQGKALENDLPYLKSLYTLITSQKKPKDVGEIGIRYLSGLTDKILIELMQSICLSLVEAGCAEEVTVAGLFGEKKRYLVSPCALDVIIAKLREGLLKNEPLSTDVACLALMLEKSDFLGRYFSKYENKRFKTQLKEAHSNESNELLKEVLDAYESLYISVFVTATMGTH
ncbi:MAG: GPP34 family phosphoprotein [Clostridiales bacterium]|jgi:hypothetical protein|nr:GPP34 family phosphoprotein [Clostridiales bacterium]